MHYSDIVPRTVVAVLTLVVCCYITSGESKGLMHGWDTFGWSC